MQELLTSVPSLRCLVTSRHALQLSGETEYIVPSLEVPRKEEKFSRLLDFPSVKLFIERAASRRNDFRLTSANADAVVELCSKLEGIPLAIELVAAWSNVMSPVQMLSRLEARFPFPGDNHTEAPERHRSLQRAFDGSYALLDTAERRLLSSLCVFTGGWTLDAAEAVCEEDTVSAGFLAQSPNAVSVDVPSTLVRLRGLVQKSLVLVQDPVQEHLLRYSLLQTTRQYARQRMSPAEYQDAELRHACYFLREALTGEAEVLADETSGVSVYRSETSYYRRMEADRENYYEAHRYLLQTDPERAAQLVTALSNCRIWSGRSQETMDWITRLAAQQVPAPSSIQARLYLHAALWASYRTLPVQTALMEKAYELAKGCADKTAMAHSLLFLGEWDLEQGNIGQARDRLQASHSYSIQTGNQSYIAASQKQLIHLACAEKEFEQARKMGEELLRSGREMRKWSTIMIALEALAHVELTLGNYSLARNCLDEVITAIPWYAATERSNNLRRLGDIAVLQNDFAEARRYLHESLTICRESEDLGHEAWACHGLAIVADKQGNNTEAMEWERHALRLFDIMEEPRSVVKCLRGLARFSVNVHEQAAFYWSAFELNAEETGYKITPGDRCELDAANTDLRAALSDEVYKAIHNKCRAMNLHEIVRHECALTN